MKKQNKKTIKKRLDKKWSLIIRSKGYCEVCKTNVKQLHPHHITGRRNLDTRWDIRNGVCLCASHHTLGTKSAHQSPLWFHEWLLKNKPDVIDYLNEKRKEPPHPYSVEDYLKIEDELDKLCP